MLLRLQVQRPGSPSLNTPVLSLAGGGTAGGGGGGGTQLNQQMNYSGLSNFQHQDFQLNAELAININSLQQVRHLKMWSVEKIRH